MSGGEKGVMYGGCNMNQYVYVSHLKKKNLHILYENKLYENKLTPSLFYCLTLGQNNL